MRVRSLALWWGSAPASDADAEAHVEHVRDRLRARIDSGAVRDDPNTRLVALVADALAR